MKREISEGAKEMMRTARAHVRGTYRYYRVIGTSVKDVQITGRGCILTNGYTRFDNIEKDEFVIAVDSDPFCSYESINESIFRAREDYEQ